MIRIVVVLTLLLSLGAGIYAALQTGTQSPKYAAGKIQLSEDLVSEARGVKTLFLVVYDLESKMPMPYGAIRYKLDQPPQSGAFFNYVLTRENLSVMSMSRGNDGLDNKPLPKRMRIKARLDRDGVAGMDKPGDLVGEVTEVAFGSDGVNIAINKKI